MRHSIFCRGRSSPSPPTGGEGRGEGAPPPSHPHPGPLPPTRERESILAALALACLLLAGCGYALVGRGSNLPADVRAVYLQPLANRTPRAQVEQILTRAIADELVTRQRFTVVADAAQADAKTVLDHYIAALSGQILVKPDFWPKRMRWGLWTALVAAIVSACGFGLEAVEAEVGELPVVLAVAGAVIALGGLVLAFLAWTFAGRQRRGRRSDGTPA